MSRWKLTIEYDGTPFCGWQKQQDVPSVQQTLEEALHKFCGEPIELTVAGRTDTGVHARGQVAHMDLQREATAETIRDAANFYLRPNTIAVIKAERVADDFHARFDAIKRSYAYRIVNRRAPLTFEETCAWHVARELDIDAMQRAADVLIGHHDFSTFRAHNCQAKSPMRTLDLLRVTRSGEEIVVSTEARSFLYHQVRNMVGTLSLVGMGRWSVERFAQAFAACDRTKGGPTAPAHGLYFMAVSYPQK